MLVMILNMADAVAVMDIQNGVLQHGTFRMVSLICSQNFELAYTLNRSRGRLYKKCNKRAADALLNFTVSSSAYQTWWECLSKTKIILYL